MNKIQRKIEIAQKLESIIIKTATKIKKIKQVRKEVITARLETKK